jgi:hypothetical protein
VSELQELLTLLRNLPEVADLQFAVRELSAAGWDEDEADRRNSECYRRSDELRHRLDSLGIRSHSEWGEGNSWSVFLETNDRTMNGSPLPGPVIADCRQTT